MPAAAYAAIARYARHMARQHIAYSGAMPRVVWRYALRIALSSAATRRAAAA